MYGKSSLLFRSRSSVKPSNPYDKPPPHMWVPVRPKSGGGGGGSRPKQKIYHRVHELDRVMELRKKPSLILELKSIIQSRKTKSLLLRDLEKEVGFVRKWNFMALIEKYPLIFHVSGGSDSKTPPSVRLAAKAETIASEEHEAAESTEPLLVYNLRKLLMLTVDCKAPLEKIKFVGPGLGLPEGFETSLIPKYPEFFSVKDNANGKAFIHLENWDSSLAVTAREENLASQGILAFNGNPSRRVARISRDGNYPGPHAFRVRFPPGFRPNTSFLDHFERWQKMEFPSPYLNARRFDNAEPETRKRVIGVIHEILSLTAEKRMTSAQLGALGPECYLPSKLLLCLIKQQGIFYITNKGERSSVFLKEGYDGSNLIHKSPILIFNAKFVALSGRVDVTPPKAVSF